MNLEYVISQNKLATIEIGAMVIVGDVILVSWKDGSTYGIDKVDSANKYGSAYLESRIIMPDRSISKRFIKVVVSYRTIPTGTSIVIKKSVNHAAFATVASFVDAIRQTVETTISIDGSNTLQVQILPVASGNTAPEIENVEIFL